MNTLIAHLVGDYILQSDWMALNKSSKTWPCLIHVILYTMCFIPFASPMALTIIGVTHFMIDRTNAAKYLIYAKNFLNPKFKYFPWCWCNLTGYQDKPISTSKAGSRPFWLTLILYIVTDNTLHLLCNALAIYWFPL